MRSRVKSSSRVLHGRDIRTNRVHSRHSRINCLHRWRWRGYLHRRRRYYLKTDGKTGSRDGEIETALPGRHIMEKREAGLLLCDFLSDRKIPQARLDKLSPADWQSLADWALRFKVGGLFYREIKSPRFPAERIPLEAKSKLRQTYRNLAVVNTNLFFDAAKVLALLADHHLPVLALKGLALAKNIYGDIALRPMSDIDLLVKEADLVRAWRLLLTLGYTQHVPVRESQSGTQCSLQPFMKKNGARIDLHWNIVSPDSSIQVDLDGLWERACQIKVDGAEVRVFSPEDSFIHLCIHAAYHLQTALDLIPFCDMARLIKTSSAKIDWQVVMARARSWGCQKCVYLMLLLVRELLGVAPPGKIMSEMEPADYRTAFLDGAMEQIFDADVSPAGQLIRIRIGKLAKINKAQGIKRKALAILKGAFPSRAYLTQYYPVSVSSAKIYLCYLFRLGRLTVFYAKMLMRILRREQTVLKTVDQEQRVRSVSDWMFAK